MDKSAYSMEKSAYSKEDDEIVENNFEYCHKCKRWFLEKFEFEKRCHYCHQTIVIYKSELQNVWFERKQNFDKPSNKRIIFENRKKAMNDIIWRMQVREISNELIIKTKKILDERLDEAINGPISNGKRDKTRKWRIVNNEKIEKHLHLWLGELCSRTIPKYSWLTEFEFFNRMFNKPTLKTEDVEKITKLYMDYLSFLCDNDYNGSINYKLFFSNAFKYFNIDLLIVYPKLSNKDTQKYLDDLWKQFILNIKPTEEKEIFYFFPIYGNSKKSYKFDPKNFI